MSEVENKSTKPVTLQDMADEYLKLSQQNNTFLETVKSNQEKQTRLFMLMCKNVDELISKQPKNRADRRREQKKKK